jgi:hypothetical protein
MFTKASARIVVALQDERNGKSMNHSEPAFPGYTNKFVCDPKSDTVVPLLHGGLTKRELFACAAMQGIVTNLFNCAVTFTEKSGGDFKQPMPQSVAVMSVAYADALLSALAKEST